MEGLIGEHGGSGAAAELGRHRGGTGGVRGCGRPGHRDGVLQILSVRHVGGSPAFFRFLVWDPRVNVYTIPICTLRCSPPRRHSPRRRLTPVGPIPPPPGAPATLTSAQHPPSRPTAARLPPTPGGICNPTGPGPARSVPARSSPPAPAAAPPPGSPRRHQPAHRVARSTPDATDPAHDRLNPMLTGSPVGPRTYRPCPPLACPPDCRLTTRPPPEPTDPPPSRPTSVRLPPAPTPTCPPSTRPLNNSPARPPHVTDKGLGRISCRIFSRILFRWFAE